MIASFTGTKKGMTDKQKNIARGLISRASEFHHGSCIGADQEAGDIALSLGLKVIIHPPILTKYKANCTGTEIREPKSYMVRDKDIVDEGDYLIATPKGFSEELRSGTWATVRYARKKNKLIYIILPDGVMWMENTDKQQLKW